MVELRQKISGCWRTLEGAQAFLTVRSYAVAARKHGVNPLAALRRLFEGDPRMPAPGTPLNSVHEPGGHPGMHEDGHNDTAPGR
jgi:hypothetical protein